MTGFTELEKTTEDAVLGYLNVQSRYWPGGNEQTNEKSQSASRYRGKDLNRVPTEYKSETLRSVTIFGLWMSYSK
jgi:hypothetical protein